MALKIGQNFASFTHQGYLYIYTKITRFGFCCAQYDFNLLNYRDFPWVRYT